MDFIESIKAAAKEIRPFVKKTPLVRSSFFSDLTGINVWFKLENEQVTGSFKARGATNKILSLSRQEKENGIISASTGNHGAAVAYAANQLGVRCTIYVPKNSDKKKIYNMKKFGANIKEFGDDCIMAEEKARNNSEKKNKVYVSPYNDPLVIAGQGTIGLEIQSQIDKLDGIIIAVGGGGLIGGIGSYLKFIWPEIRIVACSPENSAVMLHSIDAGKILDLESKPTLSDGTAGGVEHNSITFPLCSDVIDQSIFVSEKEISSAMVSYIDNEKNQIEGAAGTAVAALMKNKDSLSGNSVCVVICGGNISADKIQKVFS